MTGAMNGARFRSHRTSSGAALRPTSSKLIYKFRSMFAWNLGIPTIAIEQLLHFQVNKCEILTEPSVTPQHVRYQSVTPQHVWYQSVTPQHVWYQSVTPQHVWYQIKTLARIQLSSPASGTEERASETTQSALYGTWVRQSAAGPELTKVQGLMRLRANPPLTPHLWTAQLNELYDVTQFKHAPSGWTGIFRKTNPSRNKHQLWFETEEAGYL